MMTLAKQKDTIPSMKTDAPMFTQKLARSMKDRTAREIAEAAGLTEQQIYDYLSKGTIPRAATCTRLARAVNTSVEYLVDDEIDINPPSKPASHLESSVLMDEVACRYAHIETRVHETLQRAEQVPWAEIADAIEDGDSLESSERLKAAFAVAMALFHLVRNTLDVFDSIQYAERHHGRELPKLSNLGTEDRLGKRRASYVARIQVIYDQLTAPEKSRREFMAAMQRNVSLMGEPESALGIVTESLDRYDAAAE